MYLYIYIYIYTSLSLYIYIYDWAGRGMNLCAPRKRPAQTGVCIVHLPAADDETCHAVALTVAAPAPTARHGKIWAGTARFVPTACKGVPKFCMGVSP